MDADGNLGYVIQSKGVTGTINTNSPTTNITLYFQATPGYVGVERVEVVMFNSSEGACMGCSL